MATSSDISAQICAALALSDPNLDTSIGSPARKIIDAVAEVQAEATVDTYLQNYTYDIDSKTGGDLDDFVAVFGLARLQAQRATGVITFSRDQATANSLIATIGSGVQVMAMTSPVVYVQTMASAIMGVGQVSVDVPVQAVSAGPSGNVASGTVTNLASTINGVTAVVNTQALTNGAAAETDGQLRTRFKATVFRNLAGTDAMYRAMALQVQADPSDPTSRAVTQVNVLGPKKTWTEQVSVVSGAATSSITDAAYIYPRSVYVGTDISAGEFLTPGQFAVTINNSASPATLSIATVSTFMPDGFYDLQFDYVPTYSRNDPQATRWGVTGANITNRVDVWVNGSVIAQATQACVFSTASGTQFNATAHDPMLNTRFSLLSGAAPAVGDYFVPLGFGPITSIPATLSIGGSTYALGTAYDLVYQSDAFGYSPTSKFGLVFHAGGSLPTSNSGFSIAYSYNSVPGTVQSSIESSWRLLGTDVSVHAGKAQAYRFNFAITYLRNFDPAAVNTAIDTALASLVDTLGFNSALQASDVLQAVHNVAGVDNVRFLTSADDGTNYATQPRLANGSLGSALASGGRAVDIYFDDATYPLYDSSRIIAKARNTFGVS